MRASVVIMCVLATSAAAAPSEQLRSAEQAWKAAESERDPLVRPALWEKAAIAYDAVDQAAVDVKTKRDAAHASVLAWRNALAMDMKMTTNPWASKPRPLTSQATQLVAAADRFVRHAPDDPALPDVLFIKARTYSHFEQLESAVPIYHALIERFPKHPVTGIAAHLLVDAYIRLQQYDKLSALADELAANRAFLDGRDDRAALVRKLQRHAQRIRAEKLEADAKSWRDHDKYVAAGRAYLDIYNAAPDDPMNDEVLYNAGVSFEEGKALGSAIQAFLLLQRHFPKSRITPKGIARLARIYGDIAHYDKAAEKLEEYAKKYAGEKDAYDAMSDAIYYRRALGDRAKVIENTKYFIRTFGSRKPREAADASWSLTAVYEASPDEAIAHLRDYIRMYGGRGGDDRLVIAHARIGLLLWKQSCKVAGSDGLCVKVERAKRTCGTGPVRVLTAVERDAGKEKEAMKAFAAATKIFTKTQIDDPAARYYHAQIKLAEADLAAESFLGVTFPRDLDPARMERFHAWIEEKQKLGAKATRMYEAILGMKDAASSITAAERVATISQTFAGTLVTSATPRGAGAAYCATMSSVAEPLEARAVEGFGVCLAKSTELGWFGTSSEQCERELIRLKPDEFPAAVEVRSGAHHDALVIVIERPK